MTDKTNETFLEFPLERSPAKTVSVLGPDGRPAEGARVSWRTIVSKGAPESAITTELPVAQALRFSVPD